MESQAESVWRPWAAILAHAKARLTAQSSCCFCSYQKGLFKIKLGSVLLCVTAEAINHPDY